MKSAMMPNHFMSQSGIRNLTNIYISLHSNFQLVLTSGEEGYLNYPNFKITSGRILANFVHDLGNLGQGLAKSESIRN